MHGTVAECTVRNMKVEHRLKIEPFLNHHSRFQFTWYVQHTQIEMQKVRGSQVQISRFSGFQVFLGLPGFSRCTFSRHQCPGFLLEILLTSLSLEAAAAASEIQIVQLWLPSFSVWDGRRWNCLFVGLSVFWQNNSIWNCLFVKLCNHGCLFGCLSTKMFIPEAVCLFVCLIVDKYVSTWSCLFACLSVCWQICLYLKLSVCLFVCLFTNKFLPEAVCLFVCLLTKIVLPEAVCLSPPVQGTLLSTSPSHLPPSDIAVPAWG